MRHFLPQSNILNFKTKLILLPCRRTNYIFSLFQWLLCNLINTESKTQNKTDAAQTQSSSLLHGRMSVDEVKRVHQLPDSSDDDCDVFVSADV